MLWWVGASMEEVPEVVCFPPGAGSGRIRAVDGFEGMRLTDEWMDGWVR
jgi:hypothetical protein